MIGIKEFNLILDERFFYEIKAAADKRQIAIHKYIIQAIENSLKKGE